MSSAISARSARLVADPNSSGPRTTAYAPDLGARARAIAGRVPPIRFVDLPSDPGHRIRPSSG